MAVICVAAAIAEAQTPAPADKKPTDAERKLTREAFTIHFPTSCEADATTFADWLTQAADAMKAEFGEETAKRVAAIKCDVFLYDKPTRFASVGQCTLETNYDASGGTARLHFLVVGSHPAGSTTSVGEPMDEAYLWKNVVHEYSTLYLEAMTRKKEGWGLHSAPGWFVQGYEEYLALFHSSAHSRKVTFAKYLLRVWDDVKRIRNDFGITVQDAYGDGALLLKFMHDEFGKERMHALLRSGKATFGEAVREELNVAVDEFYERWLKWVVSQAPGFDTEFDNLKPLAAGVRKAAGATLYEGLPHQHFEKDAMERELRSKETVRLHESPFYAEKCALNEPDLRKLTGLVCANDSFVRFGGHKMCGGFHPDYCIEWRGEDGPYRVLLCFGCHEARWYGPKHELYCDVKSDAFDAFEAILKPYRKNRPEEKR